MSTSKSMKKINIDFRNMERIFERFVKVARFEFLNDC